MAKQLGPFKYEKTLGCITFYRRGDKWYARQKSSLSGRRVKTSKQFANTMKSARRLGKAASLAGAVYDKLPEAWKMFELYQQLTGIAACSLKKGKSASDIRDVLMQQLYDWGYRKELQYPVINPSSVKLRVRNFRKGNAGLRVKVQKLKPFISKSENKDVISVNSQESLTGKIADPKRFRIGLKPKLLFTKRNKDARIQRSQKPISKCRHNTLRYDSSIRKKIDSS